MKKFIAVIKNRLRKLFNKNSTLARLETQSAQAQKMQAVGQLAGGMAHDFNNILTAIIAACDSLPLEKYSEVNEIRIHAQRGANLIRQLLAFSRRQVLQPVPLDLAKQTEDILDLVTRLLGAPINVKLEMDKPVWIVLADPTQLEQIIVNLSVNARDAMPEGGTLAIRIRNIAADELAKLDHVLIPANKDFVLLEIEDSGEGIAATELGNIFEPFFSTKPQGAGLGLSTVYGIVKQSDGFIFPESKIGKGTVFRIYLPRYEGPIDKNPKSLQKPIDKTSQSKHTNTDGQKKVLLVEDEPAIRTFAARALSAEGFEVITASSAEEALELETAEIDILVSDVVMTGLDGVQLAEKLLDRHPNLKIVLISGYAESAFRNPQEKLAGRIRFLPKPFGLQELILAVQTSL